MYGIYIQKDMTTRQRKYEQTEKGKKARDKATQNYLAKKDVWKGYFDSSVTAALESHFPGMSRNAILNKLVQEYLGNT
jgi:hypothetical protein